MSIRNLNALLEPASIAVFGASARSGSVSATVWNNLNTGRYQGEVWGVNPKYQALHGRRVVARASDLPGPPDLAVICTPASTVAGLIEDLGRRGTRAVVVLTAGMSDRQKKAMLAAARRHGLSILGPNCMGLLAPHQGLNVSFSHIDALPGELAFVSQSGALVTAMLDWARGQSIGFSHFVSLGEHADVDFEDLLDYLASDVKTRAILLYIESIESPRKFLSAARAAARNKPVIVLKAGRSALGQRAAASKTGAMAGSDLVFDAAISRAGMLRVNTLDELFLAAEVLSRFRTNTSDTLTVLTNGGGAGLLAADAAAFANAPLTELSATSRKLLSGVLPANWSHANPVDIMGDAPVTRYTQALKLLLDDAQTDAILFIHAPTAIVPSSEIARALVPLAQPAPGMPPRVISCWLGDQAVAEARQTFQGAGLATFDTPEQAVRAFSLLRQYRQNQTELTAAGPASPAQPPLDLPTIQAVVRAALAQRRTLLTQTEVTAVLEACGIAVALTPRVESTPKTTVKAAQPLGVPVRAMVHRQHAQELHVGSTIDPVFGPVISFGQGGAAVDVLADRAVALPPLNAPLSKALVSRTRVSRRLAGWGNTPAVDDVAVQHVLVAVSQLLAQVPEIAELDINPLIANFEGAFALDARIVLSAAGPAGAAHFAIRPYPVELEENVLWEGREVTLRPIRPEDEALHLAFLQQLDPEDVRLRLFYSKRSMERSELARLVQIDYAREMAFIALAQGPDGQPETLGVARAMTDPDNIEAEFGVVVRSDLKGHGLGLLLMNKLIAYLRGHGTQRLVASVLDYNERMLTLADVLGFKNDPAADSSDGTQGIVLALTKPP